MSDSEGRWLYIVHCADGSYYVGSTGRDPEERTGEHNSGIDPASYTFHRRPVRLVFQEHFLSILDCIENERRVKGWARKKKEALIARSFDLLPALSKRGPKPK